MTGTSKHQAQRINLGFYQPKIRAFINRRGFGFLMFTKVKINIRGFFYSQYTTSRLIDCLVSF